MTERVLVTGAGGFVGPFVVARLLAAGYRVTGAGLGTRPARLPPEAGWHSVDLLHPEDVRRLPRDWWAVVHLAGNSVPQRFTAAADILNNVAMTLQLLERLNTCRVVLASSCHAYAPANAPLAETSPTRPHGRYGMSKLLCEEAVLAYSDRLDVRIARPFNHLGPGMVSTLAIPSLIRRLTAEREANEPLRMRGQDSIRDFIDVEDVASAYLSLIQMDGAPERIFNVCTGIPRSIGEVARTVLALFGSKRSVEFENTQLSSDDVPYLVGDSSRLKRITGWRPTRTLEESLSIMLNEALTAEVSMSSSRASR